MKPNVAQLISIARQELRRASGVPLKADEIEQHRLEIELENLRAFVYSKFSASASYALNEELIWHDDKAVVEYTVDEIKFRFRVVNDDFEFFAATDAGERQLLLLDREDLQFGNRILVAIGNYVS